MTAIVTLSQLIVERVANLFMLVFVVAVTNVVTFLVIAIPNFIVHSAEKKTVRENVEFVNIAIM